MLRIVFLLVFANLLAAGTACAQGEYSRADIDDGGRLYRANCTNCHGPDGGNVPGVDLGHGRFRQAYADADLMGIIQRGIPGTPMPPTTYSAFQLKTLVAYLRSMSEDAGTNTLTGDAVRGRSVFQEKGQCLTCHRVRGDGSRLGPDLTEIGTVRRVADLERALAGSNSEVSAANRSFRGVTRDGTVITGRFLNQDTFSVQILDSRDRLVSLTKANLRESQMITTSSMPSYRDKLTPQEIADLLSYLVSLKGAGAR